VTVVRHIRDASNNNNPLTLDVIVSVSGMDVMVQLFITTIVVRHSEGV